MSAPPSAHIDPPPHERARAGWLSTLGWACYLACSWTWCIGMFLPVLLVRDYGIWGFVVFAVPNVLGAAAMGWVLSMRSSWTLVRQHTQVAILFSLVTVGFHAAFIAAPIFWLKQFVRVYEPWPQLLVGLPFLLGCLDRSRWSAASIYVCSIGLIIVFGMRGDVPLPEALEWPSGRKADLLWIAVACSFGFLLCPYLDLTLHFARQHLDPSYRARAAFGAGFGVLFLLMVLFTLWYAAVFDERSLKAITLAAVCVHMLIQAGFTAGLHIRRAWHAPASAALTRRAPVALMVAFALFACAGIGRGNVRGFVPLSLGTDAELTYRVFMAFYGLIFPAYVWLCMIPTRDGHSGVAASAGRLKVIVWAVATAVAAPAFWMGFIEREEWWLAPGLAVVLLARLFIPGGRGFGRLPREPSVAPVPAPTRPPTLAAHATPERSSGDA